MICFIALIVFGILGIFSATHRKMAKEAFDCVFRRLTLKPCESGLDKRMKSHITGVLMRRNQKIAKFTYKNFEAISWLFTILMVFSIVFSGIGIYNYVAYGNCNGPHSDEFCIFDPAGNNSCGSEHCATNGCDCGEEEVKCTPENNFAACEGNCDCNQDVCGEGLQ